MQLTTDEAIRLIRDGAEALRQGRAAVARDKFETVTRTGRANGQIWMFLVAACQAQNDLHGEEAAIDQLLALEPRMVRAHIMKADCRGRAGDDHGALRYYESALMVADGQQIAPDLSPELHRAGEAVLAVRQRLDLQRDATLTAQGLPPEARSPRFRQSLDIMAGRKRIFVQEPTGYYFPGLPQIQYFERADFDWVSKVESATAAIRDELRAVLAGGRAEFRPYLHGNTTQPRIDDNQLVDSPDWSALFLCENGRLNDAMIARCPRTWAVMQTVPAPRIANSPTVMFSLLRAGARIAPHTGMLNTRLICHLPLIIPDGCRFRVGNEVREWEEGKLVIFDDTIEHEAWNDGDRDRIILIFDIWRPELSEQERREVAALLAGPDE